LDLLKDKFIYRFLCESCLCNLSFSSFFRDCDAKAFGAAAVQNRAGTTGLCGVSALA